MAWAPLSTAVIILLCAAASTAVPLSSLPHLDSILQEADSTIRILRRPSSGDHHRNTTAMFMPLFFNQKPVNSVVATAENSRRHLQDRQNARMPLHDDLLLNGYYTTHIGIGTPPQEFALIVDTGSTVTYVPCITCEQCGKHQDPKFQPELSSTYEPEKCRISCTCDNNREQCIYERQYAEMSSSSGVLGNDIVSFGNQSELRPQRAVFGCETMETGDLYSQHADGIMGLGRGDLSIMDQLVEKGVISDSFSLCYGGMDRGGGAMVLGGISPPDDMVFTPSNPTRSPYYNIQLKEIHVAGKALPLNPKVFDGKHGTVLDSGTTYAYLPEAAFLAFKEGIIKELHSLKRIQGPDPNYNDICFSGAGSDPSQLSKSFPSVEMVFGKGEKISLSPENYLFRHSKVRGAYCLGVFQNGKDPTTLLGGIVVRNTLVTYDREHERIGFWKTNCSELWERLHTSTALPPLPSGLNDTNSTIKITPTVAPAGPPEYENPGEMKIGIIYFYMSLSVKYQDLKPHMSELAQFIAKELDVNASQVHLIDFSAQGNETFVRWAISPADSADYLSNATARDIISKLNGNHVHLPDSFGSYKFIEWEIRPPVQRPRGENRGYKNLYKMNGAIMVIYDKTWWQKHYPVLVLTFVVMLIIGLLAAGAWLVWRRREQALVSYKPVDSVVPEQELQPL